MASSTTAILATHAGEVPARATLSSAANQLFPKETIVTRDAAGRAVSPSTADASGFPAIGGAAATYDNRTGSDLGGAADAVNVDVKCGVRGYVFTGTTPIAGDRLYVVDNQTVSTSDNGGTRGFAGICSEVVSTKAYFRMGPDVAGLVIGAATARVDVDMLTALLVSTGAPMAVFADGASSVPGVQITDSEIDSVRWNNHATPAEIKKTVYVPAPTDPAAPCVLHALVSKTGNTLADATSLTVSAFAVSVGDLHDAGSDIGGTSSAVQGDAATKTVSELTLTLTGANMPDKACVLTLGMKPTAGLLGTDDFLIHAVWITR